MKILSKKKYNKLIEDFEELQGEVLLKDVEERRYKTYRKGQKQ